MAQTCTATLPHSIRHGCARRVDHRHEADEAEARQGEVLRLRVEGVPEGKLVEGEDVVAEPKHPLAQSAQLKISLWPRIEGETLTFRNIHERILFHNSPTVEIINVT